MKKHILIGMVLAGILAIIGMIPYPAQSSSTNQDWALISSDTSSPASLSWFFETVDSPYDVGQHVSIALDQAGGTPYISFYDASHMDLRMAKYVGAGGNCGSNNNWSCETVDSAGDVGKYSSIAIDPLDDLPKIAYFDDGENALKLATLNVSGWNIKTIDDPLISSAGQYASLALNSTVKAGIAYYISNFPGIDSLRYAEYVGGGTGNCGGNDYQCDIVHSGDQIGKYASLALDSANRPHIAYYDGGNDALMYAYKNGGFWTIRKILPINSGQYASMYVDQNNGDLPRIAHYDSSNGMLEYAVYVGSGGNCGFNNSSTKFEWQCDEIESMGTATHPRGLSLTVDGDGYPIIAYQSGASVLKVARPAVSTDYPIGNCGPANPFFTWQCDAISFGIGIGQGDFISLAVNSAGLSTIAYYRNTGPSDGDLRVAFQQLQVFLPLVLKD